MATDEQLRELWVGGAAPVPSARKASTTVQPSPARRVSPETNATRSASSRHAVNVSSNWSTASTTRSPPVANDSVARGCSPGRMRSAATARCRGARRWRVRRAGPPAAARTCRSRRPDQPQERSADQARDELRDEPFAPAVVLAVSGVEGREAFERAHDGTRAAGGGPAVRSRVACSSATPPESSRSMESSCSRPAECVGDGIDMQRRLAARPLARAGRATRRGRHRWPASSISAGIERRCAGA